MISEKGRALLELQVAQDNAQRPNFLLLVLSVRTVQGLSIVTYHPGVKESELGVALRGPAGPPPMMTTRTSILRRERALDPA